MDKAALAAAIQATGFPFEYHVFKELEAAGWITLPNRVFLDPDEQKARELDVLAYKVTRGHELTVHTVLVISCKARSSKPWVLMTREWPAHKERWYSYPPVPTYSDSRVVNFKVSQDDWAKRYFDELEAYGLAQLASDPPREAFALQEFEAKRQDGSRSITHFKPIGNSSISESVMSVVKGLKYEIDALPLRGSTKRKGKSPTAFQFNLISLLDGDLYEGNLTQAPIEASECERYRYFARTMVGAKPFSARLDFCTKKGLPELLSELSRLHDFNVEHFHREHAEFFRDIERDISRMSVLEPELEQELRSLWRFGLSTSARRQGETASAYYVRESETLQVFLPFESANIKAALAMHEALRPTVEDAVEKVFRYRGSIEILSSEEAIPF